MEPGELQGAVGRLSAEFGDTFDHGTVELAVSTAYERLATNATTAAFLPLLAERFARQQLQAVVRNKDSSPYRVPGVLFLCVHNAGRSQMALGWFKHLAHGQAIAWSGGSEPGSEINPAAIAAMVEVGIDISSEFPKPWTDEIVSAADVVVTMGCGDECPYYPGKRYEDWELEDPAGQGVEAVRPIRDEIRTRRGKPSSESRCRLDSLTSRAQLDRALGHAGSGDRDRRRDRLDLAVDIADRGESVVDRSVLANVLVQQVDPMRSVRRSRCAARN